MLVLWALGFVVSMYLAGKQYDRAGYALRDQDVTHRSGVWWHTVTTVPFSRMQHCEISQGPVQHAFGLATLRIFTAGGTSSDLSIDGLLKEEAVRIKDFITEKIGSQDEISAASSAPPPLSEPGSAASTLTGPPTDADH